MNELRAGRRGAGCAARPPLHPVPRETVSGNVGAGGWQDSPLRWSTEQLGARGQGRGERAGRASTTSEGAAAPPRSERARCPPRRRPAARPESPQGRGAFKLGPRPPPPPPPQDARAAARRSRRLIGAVRRGARRPGGTEAGRPGRRARSSAGGGRPETRPGRRPRAGLPGRGPGPPALPMKTQLRGPAARAPMSASGAAAAAGGTGAGSEPGAGSGAGAAAAAAAMPCKSAEWLQEELEARGGASLLLLDCRPHELFESSHIETAINLAIPGLMLRRLRKGNLPIRSIIPNHADKERFATRCKAATVLLYDEATAEWQPEPGAPASVLGLLLQKLRDDGCQAYYLQGGFNKFQTEYSEHCETNVDSSSSPSGSPPTSVLGLGGLRISSDCSDGESDRELPSSATESDGSPVPSSQPAFPVQILPYLYLGCAKDSTNLDVLSKYGIKYILNVTPNLPNAFEHGGEFTYKQIPISDHWSQNLSQFFPEAISFIDEARSKKCGVLVHCLAGISRSVTVTVAYLMQKMNLSLNDAYDFVKRKKSNISPNFNFMGQLLDFERTLGLSSPCDNHTPSEQLYFSTPTNHNLFPLNTLEST